MNELQKKLERLARRYPEDELVKEVCVLAQHYHLPPRGVSEAYAQRIHTIIDQCFENTPRTRGSRTKVEGKGFGLTHYSNDGHFVLHHRDLPSEYHLAGSEEQMVTYFREMLHELECRAPAPSLAS